MKIRFADSRPGGDHALVIPVTAGGKDGALPLGAEHAALSGALARQRFDGEAGSAAEQFSGERRILFVGAGKEGTKPEAAEKIGGTAVARLLTSGAKIETMVGAALRCSQATVLRTVPPRCEISVDGPLIMAC